MMTRLMQRGEHIANEGRARAIRRIARNVEETAPGLRAESGEEGVAVSGRKLLDRWLRSAELRFLAVNR